LKLTYDPRADALYLRITDTQVDDTIEEEDGTIIDYDVAGQIVGIESLDASKQIQYLSPDDAAHGLLREPVAAAA
jgi:uncharacterized protein YuzE